MKLISGRWKEKGASTCPGVEGTLSAHKIPFIALFFFYETLAIPAFSFYSKINFCKSSLALFHGHILCTARAALSRSHNKLGIDKCIEIYIWSMKKKSKRRRKKGEIKRWSINRENVARARDVWCMWRVNDIPSIKLQFTDKELQFDACREK